MMFKKILVSTNGSEHAIKAVIVASDLAAKYQADLTLFHVLLREVSPGDVHNLAERNNVPADVIAKIQDVEESGTAIASAAMPMAYVPQSAIPDELLRQVGELILAQAERVAKGEGATSITKTIGDGSPATTILERAKLDEFDLIVLGSRGLSDFKGLLIGSVSHKVSHLAECTCVSVK
jgi:nucleotide-binding universal stress UspA family protein